MFLIFTQIESANFPEEHLEIQIIFQIFLILEDINP